MGWNLILTFSNLRDTASCYNCNKPGHIARDCPESGAKTCYNCGKTGHISRECDIADSRGIGSGSGGGGRGRDVGFSRVRLNRERLRSRLYFRVGQCKLNEARLLCASANKCLRWWKRSNFECAVGSACINRFICISLYVWRTVLTVVWCDGGTMVWIGGCVATVLQLRQERAHFARVPRVGRRWFARQSQVLRLRWFRPYFSRLYSELQSWRWRREWCRLQVVAQRFQAPTRPPFPPKNAPLNHLRDVDVFHQWGRRNKEQNDYEKKSLFNQSSTSLFLNFRFLTPFTSRQKKSSFVLFFFSLQSVDVSSPFANSFLQ